MRSVQPRFTGIYHIYAYRVCDREHKPLLHPFQLTLPDGDVYQVGQKKTKPSWWGDEEADLAFKLDNPFVHALTRLLWQPHPFFNVGVQDNKVFLIRNDEWGELPNSPKKGTNPTAVKPSLPTSITLKDCRIELGPEFVTHQTGRHRDDFMARYQAILNKPKQFYMRVFDTDKALARERWAHQQDALTRYIQLHAMSQWMARLKVIVTAPTSFHLRFEIGLGERQKMFCYLVTPQEVAETEETLVKPALKRQISTASQPSHLKK